MKNGKMNDISKRFVLLSIEFVLKVVSVLINLCIDQGVLTDAFKSAPVTPVQKKGSTTNVANYRPVSVLCNLPIFFVLFSIGCRISLNEMGSYLVTNLVIGKLKILSKPPSTLFQKQHLPSQKLICHLYFSRLFILF